MAERLGIIDLTDVGNGDQDMEGSEVRSTKYIVEVKGRCLSSTIDDTAVDSEISFGDEAGLVRGEKQAGIGSLRR